MDQQAIKTQDTMLATEPSLTFNENIRPLEEVLLYENENVPHRFKKMFKMSDEEVDEIFMETKRWLWFCAVAFELKRIGNIDFIIGIIKGLPVIDQMWHNFILHTEAYQEFCNEYLGGYVNHVPTTKKDDDRRSQLAEVHASEMQDFYRNQYSLTYDLLGEETCRKWYQEYASKYSKPKLDLMRKPITPEQYRSGE